MTAGTGDATDPARTRDLWARAQRVLATGLWTVSNGVFEHADGFYPLLAQRGEGCTLYDTTGRPYCDWMMGWGPVVLGYRHPVVEEAIRLQLAEGPLFPLLHPIEIEVAEQIQRMVPCAERVAFGKNGSDVLGIAVRIARAVTKREGILIHGYHGFHDWYMASQPSCTGIPEALRHLLRFLPYNDLGGVAELFHRYGDHIAAVVMEPTNTELPVPGFLAGVRALTSAHGSLLIFDEVITAFRLARGGAQEAFGVIPDLACIGKALANGMPLSALCGTERVLQGAGAVGYGLTYRGETLSLAAARACLAIHATEPVAVHLATIGTALRTGFDAACVRHGVSARLAGPPARMSVQFAAAGNATPVGLQTLFVQECLKQGVLTNGNILPSWAHDQPAVDLSLAAFDAALAVVIRAIEARDIRRFLEIPCLAVFTGSTSVEAETPQ